MTFIFINWKFLKLKYVFVIFKNLAAHNKIKLENNQFMSWEKENECLHNVEENTQIITDENVENNTLLK